MGNGTDLSVNRITPVADFTSQDFDSIKADLESYAQAKFSDRWTDFNEDQFAIVFSEMLAYLGDLLSYQVNAVIREAFAATVIRRQNLTNIGKPFGVVPGGPEAATVSLELTLDPAGAYPFTVGQANHSFSNGSNDDPVYFYPVTDTLVPVYPGGGTVTVLCNEGEYYSDALIGVSSLLPNQTWQFPQLNVIKSTIEVFVAAALWISVTNFVNQSATAQVYRILQTDEGQTFAVFGDGVFGIIPGAAAEIRASFAVGGGTRGNLNKDIITTVIQADANVLSVTNPDKSSGGADEQDFNVAKNSIPLSLSSLQRGVTTADYGNLALEVVGVAKAFSSAGFPAGARVIRVFVAPAGGGAPTDVLKNAVSVYLFDKKMVTNRIRVFGPTYKLIRLSLLVHVAASYRANVVEQTVRDSIINDLGSGQLDFSQLNFQGIGQDGKLQLASTVLQDYFASLSTEGVKRVEILRMDVTPQAREKSGGNTGDGTISDTDIITNTRQRRRQFIVSLTSATTCEVFERIIGYASSLTDTVLTDDEKIFEEEGIVSYSGYKIQPDIDNSLLADVASASGQEITISSGGSLFTLTSAGTEYALFDPIPTSVAVGITFSTPDGSVMFTVTAGSIPFLNGDSFTIDIFPHVGDIRLRKDEYPLLEEAAYTTRTSGGVGV
jgi:hypothetical protein